MRFLGPGILVVQHQGCALVGGQFEEKAVQVIHLPHRLTAEQILHAGAGGQVGGLDAAGDILAGEVEHGDLQGPVPQPVDHDEQPAVGNVRHVQQRACCYSVVFPYLEDSLEPPGK